MESDPPISVKIHKMEGTGTVAELPLIVGRGERRSNPDGVWGWLRR